MGITNAEAVEVQELHRRIDSLGKDVEALTASMQRSRNVRLLLLAALAIVAIVSVVSFYGLYKRVQSKEYMDALQAAARKQLDANSDRYLREVQGLVDHSGPVLSTAFNTQFQKDMPLYMKGLENEGAAFRSNVAKALQVRIDAQLQSGLEKHKQIIEQEVIAIDKTANIERVTENLHKAIHKLVERYHIAELERQLVALAENWETTPPLPVVKGERPQDQFIATLLELLHYRLTHAPKAVAQAAP